MRLKEFSITRFGPLPNTGRISLHHFNLFWGRNEAGKTLTIDALVKLLLGRSAKNFDRSIERVEEKPEGYVVIEDDKGKEIKLPEKGDLTKVADLTSLECRNIFVVRNSDLSIAHEDTFYTNVADRLTGLRTEEISETKEALSDLGKITPSGVFRNSGDEKLRTRIENAKGLIGEIEALARKVEKERLDEFEKESVKLREEIERIDQEIKNLEDARKRELYEKGKNALDELTNALEEMKGLEVYNESEKQLWRDCEKEIKSGGEQKEGYLTELRQLEGQLRKTIEALTEAEREFRIVGERKKKLDDDIKPVLNDYVTKVGKVKSEETKTRSYVVAAVASATLLAISIVAVTISPSPVLYGLLAFFLVATIVFAILRFSFTQKKAYLAAVFERVRLGVSKFELDAESPEKLHSNIEKFEKSYQESFEELQSTRSNKDKLEDKIRELRDEKIPRIQTRIESVEEKIRAIKLKSKKESLDEYRNKLDLKGKYETLMGEQKSVLRSHFGERGKTLEENISHWSEEVEKLEEYKDKAKGIKYNETDASTWDEKKSKCEKNLKEVEDRINSFGNAMKDIERKANDILRLESDEPLFCETSVDLKVIKDRLQSFVEQNENNRDNALKAIEIFAEIEREEKEKVSEIFGTGSPVSRYFNEITKGLYEEVLFDQEASKIQVKRRDGKMLTAEKLSGGAYDQLYFSIRLALGEKLLKGKKGFFIMDDPFIKADPDRLQRQIETVKTLSALGWQILYFSAKGEIEDALKEDIQSGAINCVEVRRMIF
jgi:uncharacterized protein YhaN